MKTGVWYYKYDQELMFRMLIGIRQEPTTSILLIIWEYFFENWKGLSYNTP